MDTYEGEEDFEETEEKDVKGPAEAEQPIKEVMSGNDTANGLARQNEDKKSVSMSSDSETFRSQMNRYMQSWNHLIMQRDSDMLRGVNLRIRCAIFFLVTLSLISFIVIDFVLRGAEDHPGTLRLLLLSSTSSECALWLSVTVNLRLTVDRLQDIEETGKFRELAATAPYMLRSQMVEAQRL
eukprot:3936733-Rhodomonas_salina.1